jgi:hypothetical protein
MAPKATWATNLTQISCSYLTTSMKLQTRSDQNHSHTMNEPSEPSSNV